MSLAKNGTLLATLQIANGTYVQVMPRKAGLAAARRAGLSMGAYDYSTATETALQSGGYIAKVLSYDVTSGRYAVKPINSPRSCNINEALIFGVHYDLGDIVELSVSGIIGRPPKRRAFISYTFDSEFQPMVLAYSEPDTLSMQDAGNARRVTMGNAATWGYCFPNSSSTIEKAPTFEVSVARNGSRVRVSDLSRSEWCSIYDDA
jgi:hypothetical protein